MSKTTMIKLIMQELGVTELVVKKRGFLYRVRFVNGTHHVNAEAV